MSVLTWAFILAAILAVGLLVPFLVREIKKGKANIGRTPTGASEPFPGTRANPAPGHPEAQADPYSPQAQRNAPPVKS
ncbi:MAG TPA: hypothetical protein VJP86_08965 [Vicinamibacterales bacterium]|nr:hypothetical protein [Vicinamibacterales bacterium]